MKPWGGRNERLERIRELVLEYGCNSTSFQIVNPGIDHWFSSRGDAVAGLVKRHGVFVVAGAPVCPSPRLEEVCSELEQYGKREGSRVFYFGAEERLEAIYREDRNHSKMVLGAQPVWRPASWAKMLEGNASLRAQLNRARNKSVFVSEWPYERANGSQELRRCLKAWLSTRGLPPLQFLVEPDTLNSLCGRRIFVAERDGSVAGFMVASPVPCRQGWLIEQAVRGKNAPNGCIELLLDYAVRAMEQSGYQYVTLGLSPLSKHVEPASDNSPLWLRLALAWIRAHGKRFYNFQGLDAFKSKFRPERWEAIYGVVNEKSVSPFTLYSVASAFAGGSPIVTIARGMAKALKSEIGWAMGGNTNFEF